MWLQANFTTEVTEAPRDLIILIVEKLTSTTSQRSPGPHHPIHTLNKSPSPIKAQKDSINIHVAVSSYNKFNNSLLKVN